MPPDLLIAPYLVLSRPATVGPWELVPTRFITTPRQDDEDAAGTREWVANELRDAVVRLVEAYAVPVPLATLGALVVPAGGHVGDAFDPAGMAVLQRALLAGTLANNPRMTESEDDQDPNAGYAVATAENAELWGHPIGNGNSYVIQRGMLARVMDLRTGAAPEPLPKVAPPNDLPKPLFGTFDAEIADAAFAALCDDTDNSRRLYRTLDWCFVALSNADSVKLEVRVGAARSAIEAMTGETENAKRVVRAYGNLMRTPETSVDTYPEVYWAKGPAQLTPDEWWLTRLSALRNKIVHGNAIDPSLWEHDGYHQLNQLHDRLIAMLKRVIARHAGDPLLEQTINDRLFPRIALEHAARVRELSLQESDARAQNHGRSRAG